MLFLFSFGDFESHLLFCFNGFEDQSVEKNMRRYMEASRPIIEYIDKLYIDRNIKLDW